MSVEPGGGAQQHVGESVLPDVLPWVAIISIWAAVSVMVVGVAAVAPPGLFDLDWGFGVLACVLAGIAAYTTRVIIRS